MTNGNLKNDPSPRRKSAGQFHHGDLASALLDAAAALIADRRAPEFSLREVAERVGVSHTAAYRHFAAKNDLLAALAARAFRHLQRDMQIIRAAGGPADQTLAALGHEYVRFAQSQPGAYRIMFHGDLCAGGQHPALAQAAYEAYAEMAGVVADGQRTGCFRTDRSADELATALWSAQHGYTLLLLDGQIAEGTLSEGTPGLDAAPPADRALLTEMMLAGLRAKPPAPPSA